MRFKGQARQMWKWVGLIWVVGFISYMAYDFAVNGPHAESVQKQLEVEFKSIEPLPGVRAFDYSATHKTRQALVSNSYKTNLPYPEIRIYYDTELAKHGWTFYEEEQVRDWGEDLGGKSAYYCKGEYRAHIQYAGTRANYGWDYAFSMSWGLDSVAEKYSNNFRKVGCR